jgi:ABC-type branched-subunit amino acid transport system substrate-binding protein
MKAGVIVSFAGPEMNAELRRLCAVSGPSVIFSGGEDIAIKDLATGMPHRYLFALDFTYFARANALAEFAASEAPPRSVAVITDRLSTKLAKGAERNAELLRGRGVQVFPLFVPASVIYQYNAQVQEAKMSGVGVITSWLDSMATLSIWRTATLLGGVTVYYAGARHKLLLDADGLVLVDKDIPLDVNEEGKSIIINKGRDVFGREFEDPVTAARAYALAKWVVGGFQNAADNDPRSLASALSHVEDIPLMDEKLSIDPGTNRPRSRKYGVLRVEGGDYLPVGFVDVFSAEVAE